MTFVFFLDIQENSQLQVRSVKYQFPDRWYKKNLMWKREKHEKELMGTFPKKKDLKFYSIWKFVYVELHYFKKICQHANK